LYKAELIHKQSWKNREAVELATLTWVDFGFAGRDLALFCNLLSVYFVCR